MVAKHIFGKESGTSQKLPESVKPDFHPHLRLSVGL